MLGDRLGCYGVFTGAVIFAYLGVRKLVSDDQGGLWECLQRGSVSFAGDLGSRFRFCGRGARLFTHGLGQDSTQKNCQ